MSNPLINEYNFQQNINKVNKQIFDLLPGEIKYYLYILVNAIKAQNTPMTQKFLCEISALINALNNFERLKDNDGKNNIADICAPIHHHYNNLQKIAQTHCVSAKITNIILHIGAIISAIFLGITGGLIGSITGFVKGVWNHEPPGGFLIGLFMGLTLGATLGFRAPKKLFKNELTRQIKFGLDGLQVSINHLEKTHSQLNTTIKPLSEYTAMVIQEIKATLNNDEAFTQFLTSHVNYEINTFLASFIGTPRLHRYVGHHAYITITINHSKQVLEYATTPANPLDKPDQQEIRTVTGVKLIEMLALHKKLQETDRCTLSTVLTTMKPGDRDCFSYVNKILLGTSQNATTLKRFANMAPVGHAIGFFIEKLSPFKPTFFNVPSEAIRAC